MPNNSTKKLAQGSMMIAIFAVLIAIAYYAPLIGLIAAAFSPLSIAWYAATYDRKSSIIVATIGTGITLFVGGAIIIPFALIFAAVGLVIGDALRIKASKLYLFISTSITLLVTFAIQYVISLKLFEVDFIKDMFEMMRVSYEKSLDLSVSMTGQELMSKEDLNAMFDMLNTMIPATVTLSAVMLAFILISVNLPLLKRFKIDVPKFNAFKDMRLPKAVLFYYFAVLCITLFWQPEAGSTTYMIVMNVSLVLWLLLILQGLSLAFFALDAFNVTKFVKVIVVIFAFPLYSLFIFIGILDLGFNVRQFIVNKSQ